MAKLAITFFSGVLVTLVVVALVRQRTPTHALPARLPAASAIDTELVPSESAKESHAATEHIANESDSAAPTKRPPIAAQGKALVSTMESGQPESRIDTESAHPSSTEQRTRPQAASGGFPPTVGEGQLVEPIPVAPEVERLVKGNIAKLHSQLEKQPREVSWSAYMEAQIAAYFGSKTQLSPQFSILLIQCRSSMCELQAVGYGPDAFPNWVAATSDMYNQPWFEFSEVSQPVTFKDDLTAILLIFRKDSGDATPQSLDESRRA